MAMGGAPGLEVIIFGRALYGLGIGFAMHAAPAYICEAAPAQVRGILIRCSPLVPAPRIGPTMETRLLQVFSCCSCLARLCATDTLWLAA